MGGRENVWKLAPFNCVGIEIAHLSLFWVEPLEIMQRVHKCSYALMQTRVHKVKSGVG